MIIGLPVEACPGETRVALTPGNVAALVKRGVEVVIQAGVGTAAGHHDAEYIEAGARTTANRDEIFAQAELIAQVQSFGSNMKNAAEDFSRLRQGQIVVGMMDPLGEPQVAEELAAKGVTAIALELVPRITRAQSMDVLSSMATIAGYKAALVGAATSGRLYPMLMTAAGTLKPSRVFIMGAGVAGLQAAATAKRLGAIVEAYDVRPAAREQILSVGAKPVELDLETESAEGQGGYAKEQGEDFLKRQREAMAQVLARQDVVITTAAIPGAKSPVLVTAEMVKQMKPGSVIVDLAAERGGNCELTRLNETVVEHGVTILGPENITATVATHASQMYGRNMENLLQLILNDEAQLALDFEDPIVAETVVAHNGEVPQARLRDLLGLEQKTTEASEA